MTGEEWTPPKARTKVVIRNYDVIAYLVKVLKVTLKVVDR